VPAYVIRGGAAGRERLRILGRVVQPTTRALLERAGVQAGLSCLDVGCGGGDATFELAQMVGPTGRVVGLDMDATKIELARREATQRQLEHVAFHVADAAEDRGGEFDVVFSRFVLTHLPDPLATLTHMVRRLRPGGLAIVEDIDFRGHFCHPDNWAFRRYVELYIETVRRRGADANIGPRLPSLLRAAGCDGVAVQVVQPAGLTGEVKLIAAITMENIADAVLAEQLATHAEIDRLVDELHAIAADDQTLISLPRIVQAWGRRDATVLR